ncbi:unnamed protein product [Prorocentrum cordatum]|uniref:Uncharacterized protein n=1 Tax=Prorocentrum cordatum TaxID=2364126 RepID=A0ABN9RAQ8_9DINO|nr:unnamed protein product [Polarella glacialis]
MMDHRGYLAVGGRPAGEAPRTVRPPKRRKEEQEEVITVEYAVPDRAIPGTQLQVTTPTGGNQVTVTVPDGAKPGDVVKADVKIQKPTPVPAPQPARGREGSSESARSFDRPGIPSFSMLLPKKKKRRKKSKSRSRKRKKSSSSSSRSKKKKKADKEKKKREGEEKKRAEKQRQDDERRRLMRERRAARGLTGAASANLQAEYRVAWCSVAAGGRLSAVLRIYFCVRALACAAFAWYAHHLDSLVESWSVGDRKPEEADNER